MRPILTGAALAALLAPGIAIAQETFRVGDRVTIGSTGESGTVIAVGQQLADGGTFIKVHLDKFGRANPQVGIAVDTKVTRTTITAAGGRQPGTLPLREVATAPRPVSPAADRAAPAIPNPPGTTASAALCQQLIRANYPPGGADQTITVSFLSFQMSAQRRYVATYANDAGGVGHSVSAAPVHAKYTVLTHFADPDADDQLRTYDAQFMCYKSARGGWVIEMVSRLPGGEAARYIHKR